ncbi:hypothetical protein LCGC14_0607400 [marine sediment metagenome]|uniref:Uncharacterized protein n=1 Tax=marine sediment metagenome TaxID=412755 RepID=A0A0F9RDH7_9ZZZZ
MSGKLSDEQKATNKAARAAKKEAEEGMVDIAALAKGDVFSIDGNKYIVDSVDSISTHTHIYLLDSSDEINLDARGQMSFGTMVTLMEKAKAEEAEEASPTPAPTAAAAGSEVTPAVSGGRWYK